MNWFFPVMIGVAALAYIFMPLWTGAARHVTRETRDSVLSAGLLELDHELGKIDEHEWKQMEKELPPEPVKQRFGVEELVFAFRKNRRMEAAAEAEVLVARTRRNKKS